MYYTYVHLYKLQFWAATRNDNDFISCATRYVTPAILTKTYIICLFYVFYVLNFGRNLNEVFFTGCLQFCLFFTKRFDFQNNMFVTIS